MFSYVDDHPDRPSLAEYAGRFLEGVASYQGPARRAPPFCSIRPRSVPPWHSSICVYRWLSCCHARL